MATLTVYSDTADGLIRQLGGTPYSSVRALTSPTVQTTNTADSTGQNFNGGKVPTFDCYEGFVLFDTSSLGAGVSISAAALTLTSQADNSATDFTIQARLHSWGATLTAADKVAGADMSSKTLLATHATSAGWVVNTAYEFTDVALPANVNKTGTTDILLGSSRMAAGNQPSTAEYVSYYAAEQTGTDKDPKLTVTYTEAAAGGQQITFPPQSKGTATANLWRT